VEKLIDLFLFPGVKIANLVEFYTLHPIDFEKRLQKYNLTLSVTDQCPFLTNILNI